MAEAIGLDTDRIINEMPELYDILATGLPPLAFNYKLYASARAHALDMLANSYFSSKSLDGRSVRERIIENGYDPLYSDEITGSITAAWGMEPAEAARLIFNTSFKKELNPENRDQLVILNPDLKEEGLYFTTKDFEREDDTGYRYFLFVCDFGCPLFDR